MPTETLKLDPNVIQKLRDHAFKKHGKLYGMVKKEAEAAILAWVETDTTKENTHICGTGKTQLGCAQICTIAADPEQREVFCDCLKGITAQFGASTVCFVRVEADK